MPPEAQGAGTGNAAGGEQQQQQGAPAASGSAVTQGGEQQQQQAPAQQQQTGSEGTPSTPAFFIPKGYEGEKSLSDIKDWDGLFKTYVEGQKLIGQSYRLPNEKDAPEERAKKMSEIFKVIGRPDTPDGYDFTGLKDFASEELKWDDGMLTDVKTRFHGLGLSQSQMAGVLDAYREHMDRLVPDIAAGADNAKAALMEEYKDENVVGRMLKESNAAARHMPGGGEKFLEWLDASGAGNALPMIEFLATNGRKMREDGALQADQVNTRTNDDIKVEVDAIWKDKSDPFHNKTHGDHDKRVDYVRKLEGMLAQ